MSFWLHVNAGYWPLIGGAETYLQAVSERFARDGDTVLVATTNAESVEHWWDPRYPAVPPGLDCLNGVKIIRSRVAHLPGSPYPFLILRRLAGTMYRWEAAIPVLNGMSNFIPWVPQLGRALEEHGQAAQLVHAINVALEGPVFQAYRFARRHRLPFIFTPFVHVGNPKNVERYYTLPHHRRLMRSSDAVIVQTQREADTLTRLGVPPQRLHQVGMGVDLTELQGGNAERFRRQHGIRGPVVTFMGAVTYDKGAIHLTQAMCQLWKKNHPATLVLAGRPIAAGGFDRFFARVPFEYQTRTLRLGQVTGELKQDLLAATDVFVMPSRVDSFGIVFLEAWAYGIPVIGADTGGVPDVIERGVDGLLVPFGEVAPLAEAIAGLLTSQTWARALGARGKAKVEARYTWDQVYQRLRHIYEGLVP